MGHHQAYYQSSRKHFTRPRSPHSSGMAHASSSRAIALAGTGSPRLIPRSESDMRKCVSALLCLVFLTPAWSWAADGVPQMAPVMSQFSAGDTALTIYNRDFAVVRQNFTLDLKPGINPIRFGEATLRLEPDSVVLRDVGTRRQLQILEQNYRNDPVSQEMMLSLFEGKTLEFATWRGDHMEIVKGRVIRSGYVPHGGAHQPIIEIDGKLQFFLPGQPIFPALADDTILKPTLNWLIQTERGGASLAEVAYVTGGMSWEADYNIVAPEKGDVLDFVGWITMNNQTGKTFDNARIKLLAGDVNKIQNNRYEKDRMFAMKAAMADAAAPPPVSEKAFDEYHLYTLSHSTTLHDQETKQVEFVRSAGVKSQRIYVYEGFDTSRYGWYGSLNQDPNYGTQSNSKIWVMQEFKNSKDNSLGIPLPRGRVRFYRRDDDGQLQFTGENTIDHTPNDETIRLYTGNTFDVAASASAPSSTPIRAAAGSTRRLKSKSATTRKNRCRYAWSSASIAGRTGKSPTPPRSGARPTRKPSSSP